MTRTTTARIGLACGFAASLTAFSLPLAPAQAQEGVAMKNLLGNMGLIAPEKDPIHYRERAPLVLPPKSELRAPATTGGLAASNPDWPRDQEVVAKRGRAAEERRPVTESDVRRMSENNPRLSSDELRRGRMASTDTGERKVHRGDNPRDELLMTPDQLRGLGRKEATTDLGPEPERRSLSEPPTGMRKAARPGASTTTASSNGWYDQQQQDANPMAWLTRKFSRDDDD